MRVDHVAYRVKDRHKAAKFFIEAFGYKLATGDELIDGGFKIKFDDGTEADCLVLEPPEKRRNDMGMICKSYQPNVSFESNDYDTYHLAPEIFISDGQPDSIVGNWVAKRGVGGIHHIAYACDDVEAKMEEWKKLGYCEFATDEPLTCPGLTQVFSKPSEVTGIIYELIKRDKQGFCRQNVGNLMLSTKGY